MANETLENLSHEDREFPPSAEFAAQANGQASLYDEAALDHEAFWAKQARSYLTWTKDFGQTLDWSDAPFAKWFVGGELNASYNCVDRHVE
ncbi:MAG: acetyl-coenzyme A synthetase N-terminal domain-containing protein, partial [Dermatophilaceae bacterium]